VDALAVRDGNFAHLDPAHRQRIGDSDRWQRQGTASNSAVCM